MCSIRMIGAVLAGCFLASVPACAATEMVLHSFGGSGDGASPTAGLIETNGTLYGTTAYGGAQGGGTVFAVTTMGAETVVYSFQGDADADGLTPRAGVINVGGALYGTTEAGGANGGGTVFSVTTKGAEIVLHSFGGSGDGDEPLAGLTNVGGTFYGTTAEGGTDILGTVFSVTETGNETVLHSFTSGGDGTGPEAGLINVGGTLYGTTVAGGANGDGTVFSVTKTGAEAVLHSFNKDDGGLPEAGLINVGGTLYGTTMSGGTNLSGTAFSFNPRTGAETVLHAFGGGGDGIYPEAGLIDVGGKFYGTTQEGGKGGDCPDGCGTVFSVTKAGDQKVLYSFKGGSDGAYPEAGLIYAGGKLYGTTYGGGAIDMGTVFSVTP